jgi:3D-(3,5/4)-trihydroxycyclohexane-1,2-dione acylhydrolase (decyclizing)
VLRTHTIADVRSALAQAREATGPVVVHVEVDRYEGVPSYDGWWDVPVAEVAADESVRRARADYERARQAQRAYVEAPPDPSAVAP